MLKGKVKQKGKVINLHRWEVHEFPWGSAVREQRTGKWTNVFIKPDGQEIDVSKLKVELHEMVIS